MIILLVIWQVLLVVLEAHHLVLLLAGGAVAALILHGEVTQCVALWVEGRHVVHVAHGVGVLGASAEVDWRLACLCVEERIGVGIASVVMAIHAAHMLGLEGVRRGTVLVLLEEPSLRGGLVVELGVEFQVSHLSLEAFVFLHHI